MKKLRIKRLALSNFKSVGQLEIQFDGGNAVISGQNGAGKTTVADAYTWALSGKMSDGKTGEIGYYDSTGKPVETNHVVEVEFTDGTTFKRESNGAAKFYVNDIPVKLVEYNAAIAAATNGAAAILAMPTTICQMKWQDRRQILMKLAEVTDAEVIASEPELEPLPEILGKHSREQILAYAKEQRRKLNAEMVAIPARIDELTRSAGVEEDETAIEQEVAKLQKELDAQEAKVQELQGVSKDAQAPLDAINRLRGEVYEIESAALKTAQQIEQCETALKNLRETYTATAKALQGHCPTCGSKVDSAKAPQLKVKIKTLVADGKKTSATLDRLKKQSETSSATVAKMRGEINEMQAAYDADEKHGEAHENLVASIQARNELQSQLNALKVKLLAIERRRKTMARIEELKQQETELSAKIAEYDQQIYLIELFYQQKIRLTEDAINSKFEVVSWKMFEAYKTADGVRECCEPMINGVPYGGNLSKGERLKATLDILKAIQQLYDVELPVFIDDAESYTSNSFVNLPNQVIRLKAVEGVSELKIEIENPQLSLFEEGSWTA